MFICDEIIDKLEELSLTVDDVEFISMEAETTTDYKDRENSSEAYAFVDAFQERMFEIYFLKE